MKQNFSPPNTKMLITVDFTFDNDVLKDISGLDDDTISWLKHVTYLRSICYVDVHEENNTVDFLDITKPPEFNEIRNIRKSIYKDCIKYGYQEEIRKQYAMKKFQILSWILAFILLMACIGKAFL